MTRVASQLNEMMQKKFRGHRQELIWSRAKHVENAIPNFSVISDAFPSGTIITGFMMDVRPELPPGFQDVQLYLRRVKSDGLQPDQIVRADNLLDFRDVDGDRAIRPFDIFSEDIFPCSILLDGANERIAWTANVLGNNHADVRISLYYRLPGG